MAGNVEDPTEDTTGKLSSEPDITISCASSPEYCNTSGLEEGSSSRMEECAGSEAMEGCEVKEGCGNDHGSVVTDDSRVHLYCCIFTYF